MHDLLFLALSSVRKLSRVIFFSSLLSVTIDLTGMLLLAAWSAHGWLPSGHAMRMALDLGLHRALEKLADDNGKQRSEEEERDLGMLLAELLRDKL